MADNKNSYLYDSQYIQSKEAFDLMEKIERQETRMLKSYIVQKDEETLIVSQHIPTDFTEN